LYEENKNALYICTRLKLIYEMNNVRIRMAPRLSASPSLLPCPGARPSPPFPPASRRRPLRVRRPPPLPPWRRVPPLPCLLWLVPSYRLAGPRCSGGRRRVRSLWRQFQRTSLVRSSVLPCDDRSRRWPCSRLRVLLGRCLRGNLTAR
jgi:hypothetical protein